MYGTIRYSSHRLYRVLVFCGIDYCIGRLQKVYVMQTNMSIFVAHICLMKYFMANFLDWQSNFRHTGIIMTSLFSLNADVVCKQSAMFFWFVIPLIKLAFVEINIKNYAQMHEDTQCDRAGECMHTKLSMIIILNH